MIGFMINRGKKPQPQAHAARSTKPLLAKTADPSPCLPRPQQQHHQPTGQPSAPASHGPRTTAPSLIKHYHGGVIFSKPMAKIWLEKLQGSARREFVMAVKAWEEF